MKTDMHISNSSVEKIQLREMSTTLSRFNFNSSEWHVMTIKVVNKKTTFYVDGEEVLGMDYKEPLGYANELTLRFKGCGAVDYVKVSNLDGKVVYEENFDPDKRK